MQPSHPRPAVLSCSGMCIFPTQGEVGGYLSQNPAEQHGIIREVLRLRPYSFPARKQLSERREAGSTAGRAPCPRSKHSPQAAPQPALGLPAGCADARGSTEPQETVTHPQLLGALEQQQSPQGCVLGFTAAPHELMLPPLSPSWSQGKLQG